MKKLILIAALMTVSLPALAESIYRARTTFGETIFQDLIVFDNLPDIPFGFGTRITGSLTVPGKFSVPLEGRMFGISWSETDPRLEIKVRVVEGGQTSDLQYLLRPSPQMDQLNGEIKDDQGKVIGQVEAVRLFFEKASP
ncbi:MAG: hypothetical protein KDD43_13995 [Bdellovibrionales bacterium]|nr:hypothetical protein [Bdellovibrionales bacterium]